MTILSSTHSYNKMAFSTSAVRRGVIAQPRFGSERIGEVSDPRMLMHELGNLVQGMHTVNVQVPIELFLRQFQKNPNTADPNLLQSALRNLEKIQRRTNTLQALVTSFRIKKEESNLNQRIQELLAFMKEMGHTGMVFEFTPHPAAFQVECDPDKIDQVLINLLGNAVDATDGKGTVKLWFDTEMSGFIRLHVQDNGPGIAPENLNRIFKKGFTTKGNRGNGLGLNLCKNIIEAHGGRISVSSPPGEGAHFILELPVKTEAIGSDTASALDYSI